MKKVTFLVAALALVLLVGNGCILFLAGGAVAAGAGTVAYIDGELKDTEAFSLETVDAAAKAALQDLKFALVSDAKTAIDAKLTARTAADTKITITLTKQSPTVTEICVRVGTFGDEPVSRQILDKIKAHLGV